MSGYRRNWGSRPELDPARVGRLTVTPGCGAYRVQPRTTEMSIRERQNVSLRRRGAKVTLAPVRGLEDEEPQPCS